MNQTPGHAGSVMKLPRQGVALNGHVPSRVSLDPSTCITHNVDILPDLIASLATTPTVLVCY